MIATNDKIIVSCDELQKDSVLIGDCLFRTAHSFETNYRYKSPTVCRVEEGCGSLSAGDILLVHHNLLYLPSPYHLYGETFAVPFSSVLFAKIDEGGSLAPICGNLFGERIDIKTPLPLPIEQREQYQDRIVVMQSSNPKYNEGDLVLARPSSCYEIIYSWNGEQKSVVKIASEMVCGVVKAEKI